MGNARYPAKSGGLVFHDIHGIRDIHGRQPGIRVRVRGLLPAVIFDGTALAILIVDLDLGTILGIRQILRILDGVVAVVKGGQRLVESFLQHVPLTL
jgi:hypothetical protein